jgi:hypothetical protein
LEEHLVRNLTQQFPFAPEPVTDLQIVDSHNYFPLSFEEVRVIMSKKTFVPIDHHGKKE